MADAQDSKSCGGDLVWVQVPPSALYKNQGIPETLAFPGFFYKEDLIVMVFCRGSDKERFITGEKICIDGGMTRQMICNGDFGSSLNAEEQSGVRKNDCILVYN